MKPKPKRVTATNPSDLLRTRPFLLGLRCCTPSRRQAENGSGSGSRFWAEGLKFSSQLCVIRGLSSYVWVQVRVVWACSYRVLASCSVQGLLGFRVWDFGLRRQALVVSGLFSPKPNTSIVVRPHLIEQEDKGVKQTTPKPKPTELIEARSGHGPQAERFCDTALVRRI